jgi:pimeloyl-ACP methyl ester carboxylesterase
MRWKGWRLTSPKHSSGVKATGRRLRTRRDSGRTSKVCHLHPSDFHGISRLGIAAVEHAIDLVEQVHHALGGALLKFRPVRGVTDFVYRQVRQSASMLHRQLETLLPAPDAPTRSRMSSAEREAVLAALNGLVGDYLAAAGNPLQIPMQLRIDGKALALDGKSLSAAFPHAGGKLLILIHGLCRSDLQWLRRGHDHGAALARDLGYTPLYLSYNSGLHISTNGQTFAALLETLVQQWPVPVEEITLLGHSMGGLVARSACYYGKRGRHTWPKLLKNIVFLGTPHHGAPLEQGGSWLTAMLASSPYTAPFSRLGRMRSAGITDLRYGNLLDCDWHGRDRFEHGGDRRQPVPLPPKVKCYTIAGTVSARHGDLRNRLLGDGLIPMGVALGSHTHAPHDLAFPRSRAWVAYGVHHLDLLSSARVYEKIRGWLAQ